MPNSQKSRVHVEYDGKASSRRRNEAQTNRAAANAYDWPEQTPWEEAKALRAQRRRNAGKTFENWLKSSAYKTTGKNSVAASEVDFKSDPNRLGRDARDVRRHS